jgi:flagellar motor switch protein FliN/FliY
MTDIGLTEEQISSMLESTSGVAGPAELTSDDLNTLTDFERQTMANLSSVLNAMTGAEYAVIKVEYTKTNPDELPALLGEDLVFGVEIDVGETFRHYIILERPFARAIAAALTGSEVDAASELGDMQMSAIQEVVAQANGTYLANLSSALGIAAAGEKVELQDAAAAAAAAGDQPLLGTLTMQSGDSASFQVRHLIPGRLGAIILSKVGPQDTPRPAAEAPAEPLAPEPAEPAAPKPAVTAASAVAEAPAAPEPAATPAAPAAVPPVSSGNIVSPTTEYKPAAFSQLAPRGGPADTRNLDILLDVPLMVTVELGKTQIPIRQILEYGQGSLITLDKLAGEPIDLLVNGKYFAKGEVVVIDENFGVRITSILSPAERIAQLS